MASAHFTEEFDRPAFGGEVPGTVSTGRAVGTPACPVDVSLLTPADRFDRPHPDVRGHQNL
ncbi:MULTISPECIES: hypothetical protein [Streptomyces]|uniref:hypothetical protein n=1 Tax=Streptomyces TaxID=1883 RepID=UPI0022AE84A4|nr:hypothetical protein [Streptomyces sp. H39-C1]MCZ4098725.1 hypothetical protein [Streptomyces sp. H39-C1]